VYLVHRRHRFTTQYRHRSVVPLLGQLAFLRLFYASYDDFFNDKNTAHLSEDFSERVLDELTIISPPAMPGTSQPYNGQRAMNVLGSFSASDLRTPVPFGTVGVFHCDNINETLEGC
jgi:hypothetical protein